MPADEPQPPRAHYEIREHSIRGLVNVVWIDPAERRTAESGPGLSLGENRLPLLADAIGKYLVARAREGQPAAEAPPPDALAQRRQRRDGGFP